MPMSCHGLGYMSTDFGADSQTVFLLGRGQTDRQTRLNALPHAGGYIHLYSPNKVATQPTWVIEYLYSPNKYGRRVNNTNTIKTTQLQIRQKTLKARFKFRHTFGP